jgi:hypothetical protein
MFVQCLKVDNFLFLDVLLNILEFLSSSDINLYYCKLSIVKRLLKCFRKVKTRCFKEQTTKNVKNKKITGFLILRRFVFRHVAVLDNGEASHVNVMIDGCTYPS